MVSDVAAGLYIVSEAESIFLLHVPAVVADGEAAVVDIVFSPPDTALTRGGVILCSVFICFFSSSVVVA